MKRITRILFLTAVFGSYSIANAQQGVQPSAASAYRGSNHTINPVTGKETVSTNWEGHDYLITLVKNKAVALNIDNKKIAGNDLPKYDSVINSIMSAVRRDEAQAERDRDQAERDRRQAIEDRAMHQLVLLLVEKKLLADTTSLKDLVLTDDELVINRVKASPEIQKEIKAKYCQWAKGGLSDGYRDNDHTLIHFHTGAAY